MTFAKPTQDANSDLPSSKPCSTCFQLTKHDVLIKYGSVCESCYRSYCRQAPAYIHNIDKYQLDPKGWAKRIIDKHNEGMHVSSISLLFAREALR